MFRVTIRCSFAGFTGKIQAERQKEVRLTKAGDYLAEGYRYQALLGKGATAEVYLAIEEKTGKQRAVKVYAHPLETAAAAEKRLVKQLYHPALPAIVEVIEEGRSLYVVMDYVRGASLGSLFGEGERAGAGQVLEWGMQLCRVLIYLHSQNPPLLYRDLKPDNIMLQANGKLKLVDFGAVVPKKRGWGNNCVGTKGYAAPEQYRRIGRLDARTDVYCLGMTLHRLLSGDLLPRKKSRKGLLGRKKDPEEELWRIIQNCTRRARHRRYRNCVAVLKALENLAQLYYNDTGAV